jgi:hypothetical protein
MTPLTVPEELRLDGICHECGGVGPVVIVQCDTDPGDMGEPRVVHADDEVIVFVPSFDLWPAAPPDTEAAGEAGHAGTVTTTDRERFVDRDR